MNIPPTHLAAREQFHLKHGGDAVCVLIGLEWCYPSGARMYHDNHHLGEEPPANDHQRLSFVLRYRKVQLDKAIKVFNERKGQLTMLCSAAMNPRSGGPAPTDDMIEELKKLQADVRRWQRQVTETQADLAKTPEALRAKQEEQDAANRIQAAASVGTKIAAINI